MNKPLYQFFTEDHRRLDAILEKAIADPEEIQMDYYQQFRMGLLTHIKMEEKTLFPAAQKANGGEQIPLAAKLRLEHGAITSLMVVEPTPEVVKVIRYVLEQHDTAEEEPGGMYDICERLTHDQTQSLLNELAKVTEVPLNPINPKPYALEAAKRSLKRAGFDFEGILTSAP